MVMTPPGVENVSGTGRILGYHWIIEEKAFLIVIAEQEVLT